MTRDMRTALRMGAIALVVGVVCTLSASACYPCVIRTYTPGTVTQRQVIDWVFDHHEHAVCRLIWTGIPWERLEDGRTLTGEEFTPVRVTQTGAHDFLIDLEYMP